MWPNLSVNLVDIWSAVAEFNKLFSSKKVWSLWKCPNLSVAELDLADMVDFVVNMTCYRYGLWPIWMAPNLC